MQALELVKTPMKVVGGGKGHRTVSVWLPQCFLIFLFRGHMNAFSPQRNKAGYYTTPSLYPTNGEVGI